MSSGSKAPIPNLSFVISVLNDEPVGRNSSKKKILTLNPTKQTIVSSNGAWRRLKVERRVRGESSHLSTHVCDSEAQSPSRNIPFSTCSEISCRF